jgi:UPF0271 protein
MTLVSIDLNADVGEGLDEADAALLPLITSANIACGGHAGDQATMARTVALCLEHGTAIGAHPGYPDRDGFGRREIEMAPVALTASLEGQLTSLRSVVRAAGARLSHVKPHGALYNRAAADTEMAALVARVVHDFDASLVLVALAGSRLLEQGREIGLAVAAEGFADRAYAADGTLRPRSELDAVHEDPRRVGMQAVSIARDSRVPIGDGQWVSVDAQTLCLHGDAPAAVDNVMSARAALAAAGVDVARLQVGT